LSQDQNGNDTTGTLDNAIGWTPPHAEPQQHDQPKYRPPDVKHDIPGAQPGGAPSTGWDTE